MLCVCFCVTITIIQVIFHFLNIYAKLEEYNSTNHNEQGMLQGHDGAILHVPALGSSTLWPVVPFSNVAI